MRAQSLVDFKTFLTGAENQSCSGETWYCIEQETQMNNPCSDTISHSKRGRNRSGKMTLPPLPQIPFHYLLHLHQPDTDIKEAWDIMAKPFSSSSKCLLQTKSLSRHMANLSIKMWMAIFYPCNYCSIIWCAKEFCRQSPQEPDLAIAYMKNRCIEGCKVSAEHSLAWFALETSTCSMSVIIGFQV